MQYNYDFHLHYQLVDASQMLGEFESFHCNRNVHNVCRYGKLNFPSCSSFNIGYRLLNSRKIVFAFSPKKLTEKKIKGRKLLFLYRLSEKALGPMSSKVDVMKFLYQIMTWYFNVMKFLCRAHTSICHFFHPSTCRPPYLRNRTSSNHNFWCMCVKWWYLQVHFFEFFFYFFFGGGDVRGVKGKKSCPKWKTTIICVMCLIWRIA